ncbi:ABC transporter substrate-binding protein [Robiginitalea aurantiaca]|uniref:ABC transporter substrate-binding protein n=1 Tax=Robiginitalea aurantiaca TaxID=3056915 RepID=A0ABT7WCC8_9FLAO|nr:ABC transporter substrate-binding protein [Robiginitalea aurantiaca]MDM9630562.1 ABC transporter substrate-binding protein [Robiginitalea aurantiaca]
MRFGCVLGLIALFLLGCRGNREQKEAIPSTVTQTWIPRYAKGFYVEQTQSGVDYLYIKSPWPGSTKTFRYALVPGAELKEYQRDLHAVDGVIGIPAKRVILTSTTHVPALETLNVHETLVGFPGLQYISSEGTRKRMASGEVQELGANENLNTEMVVALDPDLVVGFGVSGAPSAYKTLEASGIPVVYNGDWMEENPLGKAEWIVFFGLMFGKQEAAIKAFEDVEKAYLEARSLAAGAANTPTVLSGSLYRDIWYLPGGKSWAAQFIADANAEYLWRDTDETGSLSLSLESVLEQGAEADFWIAPSQFKRYVDMEEAEVHYRQFRAFRERNIYTYALSQGPGDGLWYYELGPSRPDLVLKDLIYWFHPGLLKNYEPFFFKPLQ